MTEGQTPSPQPFVAEMSDEEVKRRVRELIKLGNTPKMAELILLQSGAFPEQVTAALQSLKQQKQAELKKQNYLGWVIVLVSILLVLLAIYLWQTWGSGGSEPPSQAKTNSDSFIHSIFQSFIDNQNIPPVNDLPAPFVEYDETGKDAPCPGETKIAVTLFGGSSGKWTYQGDANGWLFYNDTPSELVIPANMAGSVAYGSARSPKFLPVIGPANVSKVHMAFILCPEGSGK